MTSRLHREHGQGVVEFAIVLPLMLIVLLAILDFARIYTTMLSVESAAREAADFGTTLGAGKWQAGTPMTDTVSEMERRACVASSNVADYHPDPDDPGGCLNPVFSYCLTSDGGACSPVAAGCEDPLRSNPCTVTVTLTHEFKLFAPFSIELFGVTIGLPSTITFQRDSTFAMTDIDLSAGTTSP